MPCNCDHMEPSQKELESKRVMKLLSQVGLLDRKVPYYGDVSLLNAHVKSLCDFCQSNNVSEFSLELQIWWRDHQAEDVKRLKIEEEKTKTDQERREAVAKLTPYERNLLGIKEPS